MPFSIFKSISASIYVLFHHATKLYAKLTDTQLSFIHQNGGGVLKKFHFKGREFPNETSHFEKKIPCIIRSSHHLSSNSGHHYIYI